MLNHDFASNRTLSKSPLRLDPSDFRNLLDINSRSYESFCQSLPFYGKDVTAGCENELQTVVIGSKNNMDLAVSIEQSNYYKNLLRRVSCGDTPQKAITGLENYLHEDKDDIWENSWVRFPRRTLNAYADNIFKADLKSDKTDAASVNRSDAESFTFIQKGEEFIRVPVSYLLKLSLADAVGEGMLRHPLIRITGEKMLAHFSNDNTSPEIFSFYPVQAASSKSVGSQLALEALIRFLFTQFLVEYAHIKFELKKHGQTVRVYFSSSPPVMQKHLNDCISDSFYRHLFMSPCLSGWTRGEEKHTYMKLCHKVLSRSQINAVSKLKEAGIITSNLVVLPNSSNISLANNGTHISLGSRKLGNLLKNPASGFTPAHEKHIGDLVIKYVEHFLCLFPGIFSASPYRLDFEDFHPEKVLGFLPHELDYTHLRMIWRRWKRKAKISILGNPVTPFGPVWLDRMISRCFALKGDFVPDFRLVDYFISLMSTHQSPCLDGTPGNGGRLKKDLAQMGIFDERMPLYQLIRIREFSQMGYSGFEHRYHSIFENILTDMGQTADLQNLLTLMAFDSFLNGRLNHSMIPDSPEIESERRQIFFCSAIGLPTFFVKTKTRNIFLQKILSFVKHHRHSRRYRGYTRVHLKEYRLALVRLIRQDGAQLIELLKLKQTIDHLEQRIIDPQAHSTGGRLLNGILASEKTHNPLRLSGRVFNRKAEQYYIETLRKKHMAQGMKQLADEFSQMKLWGRYREPSVLKDAVHTIIKNQDPGDYLKRFEQNRSENPRKSDDLLDIIHLMIIYIRKQLIVFEG